MMAIDTGSPRSLIPGVRDPGVAGLEPLEFIMFNSKKTSTLRDFTNSIGLTKAEPTGWEKFKAGAGQFWADDKASVSGWFDKDHQRRMELAQARNTFTVGIAWPGGSEPKSESSVVGAMVGWALANPEKVVAAVGLGVAGGKWIADRVTAGAPKAEPEAPEAPKA